MKLLFAYFDFSKRDNQSDSSHLDDDYSINFSTEYDFSVIKKDDLPLSTISYKQYNVIQKRKPAPECIPKDFWGERIYNITAIVGDNGSGKSTLLHSIIRTIVYGLDPGVPFLLILQEINNAKLHLYCSDVLDFSFIGESSVMIRKSYPKELRKAKCMLLDNTLSLSSLQLSNDYDRFIESEESEEKDDEQKPYKEWGKQFYNKSLFASIQFSNNISASSLQSSKLPISTDVLNHLKYESFQEIRFLFDGYYRRKLDNLEQKGYHVPHPKYFFVSVTPAYNLSNLSYLHEYIYANCIWRNLFISYEHQGFVGKIMIDAMINLLHVVSIPDSGHLNAPLDWKLLNDLSCLKEETNIETIGNQANKMIDEIERNWKTNVFLSFSTWRKYFANIVENYEILQEIFRSSTFSKAANQNDEYIISTQEIISSPAKQKCLISFLDVYVQICEPRYFLTFFSGMSSGEKNLLRMLIQFRHMFKGPTFSFAAMRDTPSLQNKFHNGLYNCDTLFLFLDEVDLTYHPEWQRIIIAMLNDVLPLMFQDIYVKAGDEPRGCRDIQIILATHSPLILGDFPKASVIHLPKDGKGSLSTPNSTFGENLYTILKDGFFISNPLGAFAKRKIDEIINWCIDVKKYCDQRDSKEEQESEKRESHLYNEWKKHFKTMQLLPPGIIQNKLMLELVECAKRLPVPDWEKRIDKDRPNDPVLLKRKIDELNAKLIRAEKRINELQKGGQPNE